MKHQIALFSFTLGNDQSIGPAALRALWARACQSSEVSVGRQARGLHRIQDTYFLYASQRLGNLPLVEQRLRMLFEQSHLAASLTPLAR